MMPRWPLYIPTKGRSEYMITSRALTEMGVPHFLVVEPQEVPAYEEAVAARKLTATILTLDLTFKEKYELCDDLGLTKSTGPGPARNFAWEHSIAAGFAWHWVMDDNILDFRRLNLNEKVKAVSPGFFRAMEDFSLRYVNVGMAGPNYYMFAPARTVVPPFVLNTRIYSCNLIRNDLPFRWRGRYNEDTILSLDMLKRGWVTVQFNSLLQRKMPTQTIGGGNSKEFYFAEGQKTDKSRYAESGTTAKSKMLVKVYPDVARLVWRFGRVHHHVDYRPFKKNKLVRRPGVEVAEGADNYGMKLVISEETGQ